MNKEAKKKVKRPTIKGVKKPQKNVRIPKLKFDEKGLIVAIVQDNKSGDVVMVAYMNKESLRITLKEKKTCFWSRSRKVLWRKGETSGHIQKVKSVFYDCDKDALLIKVDQVGVACHTGEWSCFFRKI
ncbi:MAG: phosphoribosyl-AMP cyclohydrolase [Candidatus Omnitrophica bacterium]|nr:phosphoribosyl-AMP cyclohydrolase [Candidatus Omnitrophota bacterium]